VIQNITDSSAVYCQAVVTPEFDISSVPINVHYISSEGICKGFLYMFIL